MSIMINGSEAFSSGNFYVNNVLNQAAYSGASFAANIDLGAYALETWNDQPYSDTSTTAQTESPRLV
jgi:hypothetical protein